MSGEDEQGDQSHGAQHLIDGDQQPARPGNVEPGSQHGSRERGGEGGGRDGDASQRDATGPVDHQEDAGDDEHVGRRARQEHGEEEPGITGPAP